MTNLNVDTKVIKEFTGHVSNAVEGYKHIDDNIRRQTSAIKQGHGSKVVSATVSKPPDDDCNVKASESSTFNVRSVAVISKISDKKKCKKIKINIEFIESN